MKAELLWLSVALAVRPMQRSYNLVITQYGPFPLRNTDELQQCKFTQGARARRGSSGKMVQPQKLGNKRSRLARDVRVQIQRVAGTEEKGTAI